MNADNCYTKAYHVAAAIIAYVMVVWADEDLTVKTAVDGSAPIIGVTPIVGADNAGDIVDVVRCCRPDVRYGGVVTRGDRLTADAQGRAIPAQAGNYYLGFAEVSGVEGDIAPIFIAPGRMPA